MQIVRNIGHIKEQQRQGRILTAVGFVGLAAAFILVWVQRDATAMVLIAYALMLVGFVFFNMGLQRISKFVSNTRKKRPDQEVDAALARLNDRYTAIHYAQLGNRVVDHLVVHPAGVVALTLREVTGKIIVNERRWRKGGNPLGRIFNYSAPQLGNPSLDNETDVEAIRSILAVEDLPDAVSGAIVFTSPQAEVQGSCPIDVLGIDQLLDHLRTIANEPGQTPLTGKQRLAIIAALSQGKELEQPPQPRTERRKREA